MTDEEFAQRYGRVVERSADGRVKAMRLPDGQIATFDPPVPEYVPGSLAERPEGLIRWPSQLGHQIGKALASALSLAGSGLRKRRQRRVAGGGS